LIDNGPLFTGKRSAGSSESASKVIRPPDSSAYSLPRWSGSLRSSHYVACCGATVLTRLGSCFIESERDPHRSLPASSITGADLVGWLALSGVVAHGDRIRLGYYIAIE
jgi:hypothetical protein